MSRETRYRTLSANGNPRLDTLTLILEAAMKDVALRRFPTRMAMTGRGFGLIVAPGLLPRAYAFALTISLHILVVHYIPPGGSHAAVLSSH